MTHTENQIIRAGLSHVADLPAVGRAPAGRAAQRAIVNSFNNVANATWTSKNRAAGILSFNATRATAEGIARNGFHVWRTVSQDGYVAIPERS